MRILPRLALALVALATLAAPAAEARTTAVPPDLQPQGVEPFDVGHAFGVQIYACNGAAWTFVAPRATLITNRLHVISHFAGPTWQDLDQSSVVGQVVKAVTVNPNAIPWVLLSAKSTTAGPHGSYLTKTKFIQRINTRGGLAPAASTCTPERAGRQVEVPYTADYVFWR